MKSFIISNLLLGAMLGLLASCGGSKVSKTSFVVSQNFSIVNSGYEGGLSIYGKNLDTGENFAYSSLPNGGQNQIVLDLQKGNWSFGVVGWSGGGSGNNLKGTPYCGAIDSVNLNSSAQTVNLSATQAACLTSAFTTSSNINTTSTPTLKSLILNLCPKIATGNLLSAITFCKDQNLDESLGDDIWSIKLQLPSKALPGTSPSAPVQSACMTASNLGNFDLGAGPYKIVTKNFPINIIAFKDKNCQVPSNLYIFEQGLEATYGFDKIFMYSTTNAETPHVFLLSSKTKKMGSALDTLIPSISCSSGDCSFINPLPIAPSTVYDYYISGNSSSQIILDPLYNCSSITDLTSGSDLTFESCEDRSDRAGSRIRVTPASNSVCLIGSPCTFTFKVNGTTQTKIIVSAGTNPTNQLWQQELILKTLGINNLNYAAPLVFSLGNLDQLKKSGGILSDVQEMMSSSVIGGAFKEIANCSALSGTREIDVFDEGQFRRFRVAITGINEAIPRQLCNSIPSSTGECSDSFDKRIVLSLLNNNIFYPQKVLKIDCNNRAGMSEDIHSNGERNERRLIYWNTPTATTNFRIQEYSYEKEMTGSAIKSLRTGYTQVSRASSASEPIRIIKSEYEYSLNNGSPFERLTKNELQVDDGGSATVTTANKQYNNSTSDSAGKMFILPEMKQLLGTDTIHQYNLSSGVIDYTKSVKSPNGAYKLIVSFTSGTPFTYQIVSSSGVYKKGSGSLYNNYSQGDISINDSGRVVIGFVDVSSIKFITFLASDSSPSLTPISTGLPASASSKKIKIHVGNDDLITVAEQSASAIVSARIIDTSGALSSGNTSNGFDFQTSTAISGDFIIHHTDGLNAKFCYFSNPSIKCDFIQFPNFPTTGAAASITGAPSGINDPAITILSGFTISDTVSVFTDPGCSTAIFTQVAATSTLTTNIVSSIGMNNYYMKVNSGTCTALNISYYKSAYGRYITNSTSSTIGSGTAYIDPKFSYDSTSDNTEFNLLLNQNVFKKITVNTTTVSTSVTSGAALSVSSYDNSFLKTDVPGSATTNGTFIDFDQADVPIKYPSFDGSSLGLKPQIFINNFSGTLGN